MGTQRNSQGYQETWVGYKLHIDTADGDIPVAAILTSASLHDNPVALSLMHQSSQRVTYLYDLADSAYCSPIIRDEARRLNHVPLIDHTPPRGKRSSLRRTKRSDTRPAVRLNGSTAHWRTTTADAASGFAGLTRCTPT